MSDEDKRAYLAELFLKIVLFILPRDSFDCDRCALLRLSRIRKDMVEHMRQSSGGFTLDLHMSYKNIVMVSPYPHCIIGSFNTEHFNAMKKTASRFQSINSLCVDLQQLPRGCNLINTRQVVELAMHCLQTGRAKHLTISHAVFEADTLTNAMRDLAPATKQQILSVNLSHCRLAINSPFLRQLASMHNLTQLILDGNKFHLAHSGFPPLSPRLEVLSLASCTGLRPSLLQNVSKTLHTLVWNDNVIVEDDKPVFLSWITDSHLRNLEVDNCGFFTTDSHAFQAALARMPALRSLSMADNDVFQDMVFWWIYDFWQCGRLQSDFFSVHVSNMHICYPTAGLPVVLSTTRFGFIEIM